MRFDIDDRPAILVDDRTDGWGAMMLDEKTKAAAAHMALPLADVPEAQRIAGTPRTGAAKLGEFGGVTLGVWEMTPGTMRDVEIDEVFVVLHGAGTVEFSDGTITSLEPGDVLRLHAGQRTIWTVTQALRKVYLAQRT
jgi:uncharacterized cupin superfamily protein